MTEFEALIRDVLGYVEPARCLGARTLSTGVELIGHIPHVAPEAYLHVLFPGIREGQINAIEHEIGRPLPAVYREFLSRFNGAWFYAYSLALNGLRFNYEREGDEAWQPFDMRVPNTFERPKSLEDDDVVFGGYRDDGSLLYIKASNGQVRRCARRSGKVFNTWDSFGEYLRGELKRLSALFDKGGHFISKTVRTTLPLTTRR